MKKNKLSISVGIFVYNEEQNIEKILNALLKQKTDKINLKEIIVVSSGSTDNTDSFVKIISKKNKKVKLFSQKQREGKASAINLFLKKAKSEIVVIESGDTIPKLNCIENLCAPFIEDPKLGFTGARSIPTNDKKTFLGYIIHYWWWISNELPRFGEMVAFRKKLSPKISVKTAVDEAYIESLVTKQGYTKEQIPSAIVNNRGSATIKDIIKQRKRIYMGHLALEREQKYSVQSFNFFRIIKLTWKYLIEENSLKGFFYLSGGAFIEFYSRLMGMKDIFFLNKNPYIWDIAKSTKKVK